MSSIPPLEPSDAAPPVPPPPTHGTMGRMVAAVWRRRFLSLAIVLVCTASAVTASLLLPIDHRGEVQIQVGQIAPVGSLESPEALARRLSSPATLWALGGEEVGGLVASPALRDSYRLHASVIPGANIVVLAIAGPDETVIARLIQRASAHVLAEHRAVYDAVLASNEGRAAQFNVLLGEIRRSIDEPPPDSAEISKNASDSRALLLLSDAETTTKWGLVVGLQKHIDALRDRNLVPKAEPSRLIYGPDVEPARRYPAPMKSGVLGAVAGLLVSLFLVLGIETAKPYL